MKREWSCDTLLGLRRCIATAFFDIQLTQVAITTKSKTVEEEAGIE